MGTQNDGSGAAEHREKAQQYLAAVGKSFDEKGFLQAGTKKNRTAAKAYCFGAISELTQIPQESFTQEDRALLDQAAAVLTATAQAFYIGNGTKDRPDMEFVADYEEAKDCFDCYKLAAQLGERKAYHYLGKLYYTGCGTKKDDREAVRWFEKSMAAGETDSAVMLGYCYYNGSGTEKNLKKAFDLVSDLAASGDQLAGHLVELITQEDPALLKQDDAQTAPSSQPPRGDAGSLNRAQQNLKFQEQMSREAAYQETVYQDTEYQETEYQGTEYPETEYLGPAHQETEYLGPSYQKTAYQETVYQAPAYQQPVYQGQAYPPQGQGYIQQEQSYPPQGPGYPSQGPGYPPQGQNYPPQEFGYPPQGPGYVPQGGQAPGNGEKKGSAVKTILLIILLAAVLAALGFGVYTILSKRGAKDASGQEGTAQADAAAQAENTAQVQKEDAAPAAPATEKVPETQAPQTPQAQTPETAAPQTEKVPETQAKQVRHTYELIQTDMTWEQAAADARGRGGYLATISSQQEQMQIENMMTSYSSVHTVWLGARRLATGSAFAWNDGQALTYTQWGPGEPNNETGDELYLDMYELDGTWYWNDVPNDIAQYYSGKMGYVLEREITE